MNTPLLAALLIAAIPSLALAQAATSMQAPNQSNPQARANEQLQPLDAHRVERGPGLGEANSIPTPTFDHPVTKMDKNQPRVPHTDPLR